MVKTTTSSPVTVLISWCRLNMSYYDKDLKRYAASGLRTAEDWASLGRGIDSGMKPRADILQRGKTVSLYCRNQTRVLHRER